MQSTMYPYMGPATPITIITSAPGGNLVPCGPGTMVSLVQAPVELDLSPSQEVFYGNLAVLCAYELTGGYGFYATMDHLRELHLHDDPELQSWLKAVVKAELKSTRLREWRRWMRVEWEFVE